MAHFDYISELKKPRLKVHDDGSMPSPMEIDSYLSDVERMRQEFLSFVLDKDSAVVRAYLNELEEAKRIIDNRGYHQLRNDNIVAFIVDGNKAGETLQVLKSIDSRLYSSVINTISFIKSLLGEEVAEPPMIAEPKNEEKQDEVIRGVKGLAEFLKVGTTKAQAIINSKILTKTKPAIQYYAGAWLFNKERLQDYITENPEAFRDIKCPH